LLSAEQRAMIAFSVPVPEVDVSAEFSPSRHEEEHQARRRDAPGVVAPPPLIYVTALALGFVLEALLPSAALPRALAWPLGTVLIVGGLALGAAFVAALRAAHTPVNPARPTSAIVTTGPYRLTRNPGYVGMTLMYAGIAVLAGALWPLASLLPALVVVDRGVIAREEDYLRATFGEEYLRYQAQVRRWL
jgi:protein-S-isoprenylcysteine O-methyltransferase Ste14